MPRDLVHYMQPLGLLIGCGIASVCDIRFRKVPNQIPAGMLIFGLLTQVFNSITAAAIAVGMVLLMLIIGTFLFTVGWFGGGDIKLIAACFCYFSPINDINFLLYTTLSGGILALIFSQLRGKSGARTLFTYIINAFQHRELLTNLHHTKDKNVRLPYALAITIGATIMTLPHIDFTSMRIQ